MNILSLQSHVAYGHVGNSAAVFALQRIGVEVWPIHTVQFSNHTGYATAPGRAFDAAHIRELMQGFASATCSAAATACCRAIWARPRSARRSSMRSPRSGAANPRALYCCDPVIGDVGRGAFVRAGGCGVHAPARGAGRRYRDAEPFRAGAADGPHHRAPLPRALAAIDALRALGPKVVLVTSLLTDETPGRCHRSCGLRRWRAGIGCARPDCRSRRMARATPSPRCSWRIICAPVRRPRRCRGRRPRSSASSSARRRRARREMLLIEAQDELVIPSETFPVEPV